MAQDSKEAFLFNEIDQKIEDFQRDSKKHKDMHRNFRYWAFGLTAVLSTLSGLALYYPENSTIFNISILAITAIAGFLSSVEGIRKADELWIHERTTYYALKDLKRELEFELRGSGDKTKVLDACFVKLQSLLNQAGEKWSSGLVAKNTTQDQS